MAKYGKAYGGAHPELIEGDIFRMIVKVPEFGAQPEQQSKTHQAILEDGTKLGPSRDQVEILRNCLTEKAIGELMKVVGRTNRTKFRDQVLKPLLVAGWLEMTNPDKPTSSKQKYRLTDAGKRLLKSMQE